MRTRKLTKRQALFAIRKAERFFRSTKRPGTTCRAISAAALDVYRVLVYLSRKGRVVPSVAFLAERTSYSRATVFRALKQLESVGLVIRHARTTLRWLSGVLCTCSDTNAYELPQVEPSAPALPAFSRVPPSRSSRGLRPEHKHLLEISELPLCRPRPGVDWRTAARGLFKGQQGWRER